MATVADYHDTEQSPRQRQRFWNGVPENSVAKEDWDPPAIESQEAERDGRDSFRS